jgi:S-adenosylmethionine:tRNA ribosyltransferase-isomerase
VTHGLLTADYDFDLPLELIAQAPLARGVTRAEVVLHVGAGTFKPVETGDPAQHIMHEERYAVPPYGDAMAIL